MEFETFFFSWVSWPLWAVLGGLAVAAVVERKRQ